MKKKRLLFLLKSVVLITLIISLFNCKKDSDNNIIVTNSDTIAWAVGELEVATGYGMILYSKDGGINWTRQGVGEEVFKDVSISDLYVLDKNTVWVVCSNTRIAKTTDGGISWNQKTLPSVSSNHGLSCISIVDNTNIWISGGGGYVANSTDDGESWTLFDSTIFNSILCQGICAINSQIVYVVGNDSKKNEKGMIRRTLNGGASWENIELDDDFDASCGWIGVTATDVNHVIAYSGLGYYTYTTDGGISWVNDSIQLGGGGNFADINDLIMLDNKTWWAALDLDHIIFTTDSGANWSEQQSSGAGNQFLVGIDAYDNNLALITGTSAGIPYGKIIRTTNGGTVWTSVYEDNTNLWKVSFVPK